MDGTLSPYFLVVASPSPRWINWYQNRWGQTHLGMKISDTWAESDMIRQTYLHECGMLARRAGLFWAYDTSKNDLRVMLKQEFRRTALPHPTMIFGIHITQSYPIPLRRP